MTMVPEGRCESCRHRHVPQPTAFGAYIEFFKLKGLWPKTEMDVAAVEEDRRMRHDRYHCERNPEAFERSETLTRVSTGFGSLAPALRHAAIY
jgi:hypothetical protein